MESALQLGTLYWKRHGSPKISKDFFKDLRLNTQRVVLLVPTFAALTEENDGFYGKLSATIEAVSKSGEIFLLGDFNAWVMITPHGLLKWEKW